MPPRILVLVPTPAHVAPSLIENGSASLFTAKYSGATIDAVHQRLLVGHGVKDDADLIMNPATFSLPASWSSRTRSAVCPPTRVSGVTYLEIVSLGFGLVCPDAEPAVEAPAQTTMSDARAALLKASARWCHVLDCGA